MKLAGLSISVQAAIIVDPVSNVGALLHFCQQNAGTNCMKSAGRDKENISFFNWYFLDNFQQRVICNTMGKFFSGNFF